MNQAESIKLAKWAGELFKDLTGAQMKLLAEQLLPHDHKGAVAAMKTHRTNHIFFDFPQFFEAARIESNRSRVRLDAWKEQRIGEWLLGQAKYAGMSHADAILRHFEDAWEGVSKCAEPGRGEMQKLIKAQCRTALLELGWPESDASETAGAIVGVGVLPVVA